MGEFNANMSYGNNKTQIWATNEKHRGRHCLNWQNHEYHVFE